MPDHASFVALSQGMNAESTSNNTIIGSRVDSHARVVIDEISNSASASASGSTSSINSHVKPSPLYPKSHVHVTDVLLASQ